MRKKTGRRLPGSGSIRWSDKENRYIAETSSGFDNEGHRVRSRLVGPRGDKSDDAYYGLKDRLEQLQRRQPPRRRGQLTSRMTLREYLRGWLRDHTLSQASLENYTWAIEKHLIPHLGNEKLHALDRKRLRTFFSSLTTLEKASKEKIRTVIGKALQDALDDNLIIANPASRLDIRDRASEYKPKEIKAWSKDEAARFLKIIEPDEHFSMILMMIRGSLGPAETFGLQWRDIQLDRGWVSIIRNLTEVSGKLYDPKDLKRKARRRGFHIPHVALRVLRERYKRERPEPTDYVFTAPEGGPIQLSNFRKRVWAKLIKEANVTKITPYGLRHSSASLMAAMGIPLLIASRVMGHSNVKVTDKYSHLFNDTQEAVDAKFDAFFKKTLKKRRRAA